MYDSGAAQARYLLDISQPRQAAEQLRALFAQIKQDAASLQGAAAPGIGRGGGGGADTARQASGVLQLQRAQAALEAQQARLARQQGDGARAAQLEAQAQQRLMGILAQQDTTTVQTIAVQRQLTSVQAQAAQGARGFGSSLTNVQQALGGLGIVLGTRQLIDFGIQAGQASLSLDHTERITREIAGSQDRYNQIIAEARAQQRLFGGSLEENIDGLSGLAVTAKNTGARLETLIDLQKRLSILNPSQGAQGGLIALNEALAGNIASLSRRFNIPRDTIRKLGDESLSASERLKVLDEFLNKVGITSAAVNRATSETAQTYNELGAAADNAKVRLGGLTALRFAPVADDLTKLLNAIGGTESALSGLRGASDAVRDIGAATFNPILDGLGRYNAFVINAIGGLFGLRDEQQQVGQATQVASGQISYQSQAMIDAARSETKAREAIDDFNAGLTENAAKAQISSAESQLLKTRQEEIADASLLAAKGMLGAGDQADILARKYNLARSEAELLIGAQQDLLRDQAQQDFRAAERSGGAVISEATRRQIAASRQEQAKAARDDAEQAKQIQEAQFQLQYTRAKTSAERIALLKRKLATTDDALERLHIEQQIAQERTSAERTITRAESTAARKAQTQIRAEATATNRIESIYEDHFRRLRDMDEDYQVGRGRDEEDFARTKRRLLAEGRILEARQAQEDFDREQRRKQEDYQRQRRRTLEDQGIDVGRASDSATIRGITPQGATPDVRPAGYSGPVVSGGPAAPLALPPALPPSGAAPLGRPPAPRTIALTLNAAVTLDGQQVGKLILPTIEQQLEHDLLLQLQVVDASSQIGLAQAAFRPPPAGG